MPYDETYRKTKDAFGAEPEVILRKFYRRIDRTEPVLDIGAGQGRNALFLAREGFTVDAIDTSKVAIETISAIAKKEGLPIRTGQCGIDEFVPETDFYAGILIFGLIQILSWEELGLLLEKIRSWTRKGSLVFVTGFTVADPSFARYSQTCKAIGKNSFAGERGDLRTYLDAGEILNLFSEYEVVHHWEGMGPEHRHGDSPLERHAIVEAVFRR
jgi:cyclopropane fatty-acyl-phospholipid synthase-like methyltransferase